jgi:hypothetical protein
MESLREAWRSPVELLNIQVFLVLRGFTLCRLLGIYQSAWLLVIQAFAAV